jgi:hypothetical protein
MSAWNRLMLLIDEYGYACARTMKGGDPLKENAARDALNDALLRALAEDTPPLRDGADICSEAHAGLLHQELLAEAASLRNGA